MKNFDEWFGEFGSEEEVDVKVTPSPRKLTNEPEFDHYLKPVEDDSEAPYDLDYSQLVLSDDEEFTDTCNLATNESIECLQQLVDIAQEYCLGYELAINDYASFAEMEVRRGVNPEDLESEYYVSFMLKELGYPMNLNKDHEFPVLFSNGNCMVLNWYQLINNREHITFDLYSDKIVAHQELIIEI